MIEEKTKIRGDVKAGKTQVNWRIDERAFNKLKVAAPEQGFSSVPAMVNYILVKVLSEPSIFKSIFGGSPFASGD